MEYLWVDLNGKQKETIVAKGQMVYTPPKVPHKMVFLEDSIFIAIAAKNRSSENYEADTTRLESDYFSK